MSQLTIIEKKTSKVCPECLGKMTSKGWVQEMDNKEYDDYHCSNCNHLELVERENETVS